MVYSYIYKINIYIIIASVVGHGCSAIYSSQIKKVNNRNYCVSVCAGQRMTLWGLSCPHLFLWILWSEFPVTGHFTRAFTCAGRSPTELHSGMHSCSVSAALVFLLVHEYFQLLTFIDEVVENMYGSIKSMPRFINN